MAVEKGFLPSPGPIRQGQLGKNRVSMTLKRDGANLNIGATFADELAITGEGSQPQIDARSYTEVVLAQDMKITHLEHGIGPDVVKTEA